VRSSTIYDFLVVESEAWPLASRAAFEAGTTGLEQQDFSHLDENTSRLSVKLLDSLRPRAYGMTLDVLTEVRDHAWFDAFTDGASGGRDIKLAEYLLRLAKRYLESRGARLCLREDVGIGVAQRAERWRWLASRLPQDLLAAALAAEAGREPQGEQVSLLTPQLARILAENDVAETHLHVGAAVSFPLVWTAKMAHLCADPLSLAGLEQALEDGGPPPFGSGREFLRRLREAAVARLLMAAFLERESDPLSGPNFEEFCNCNCGGVASIARAVSRRRHSVGRCGRGQVDEMHGELLLTLASLGWPMCGFESTVLPILCPQLAGAGWWHARQTREIAWRDPLSPWLEPQPGRALPETLLTSRALAYLLRYRAADPFFERIFWQYQRVRCQTYQHVVEPPGTGGLDWFSMHYRRLPALRRGLEPTLYRQALENESVDLRLGALEVRTEPPVHWWEVCHEVRSLAEQTLAFRGYPPKPSLGSQAAEAPAGLEAVWPRIRQLLPELAVDRPDGSRYGGGMRQPEVAIIFHFVKARRFAPPVEAARASGRRPRLCRYGSWYCSQIPRTAALCGALKRKPEILLLFRGLDIANAELAIPTWVTLPLFDQVRRASTTAASALARKHPDWQVPRLRITCHLGEDFVRLAQGLRRIHEPIEFGLLETGSRIGHAVALGKDPAEWAGASTTVPQLAEERLADLLWELDRYGQGDLPAETGRLEYVRHEAVRLSRWIFDASPDLDNLREARRRLHSPQQLAMLGFPAVRFSRAAAKNDKALWLIWRFLTDPEVYARGQEQVEVRVVDSEVPFLRCAQHWLRRVLGQMEITVESNPSSNLLVGGFESFESIPAFRMLPLPSKRGATDNPIMVSVSSDDPITFASHLADEYAHIYFALTRQGVMSEEALAWLDEVRRHGWYSRFSLPASRSPANLQALYQALRS
jgi:hypothetical protein